MIQRPTWPHTLYDIQHALEDIWGVVGAYDENNNLHRLEKNLYEPFGYTLVSFIGSNESEIQQKQFFELSQKDIAIKNFAQLIGLK